MPTALVTKYVTLGLPQKADAVIGAFAEWQGVKYLISDNRHFLVELDSDARGAKSRRVLAALLSGCSTDGRVKIVLCQLSSGPRNHRLISLKFTGLRSVFSTHAQTAPQHQEKTWLGLPG